MSIKIKISKKLEPEFETEYLEICAETSSPHEQIIFYINDNHFATTMTDDKGVAIAGTSFEEDKTYTFSVECAGETESVEYHINK